MVSSMSLWRSGARTMFSAGLRNVALGAAEKERGIRCSRARAREIIDRIDNKQDCSLGITWDTIDCYLYGV